MTHSIANSNGILYVVATPIGNREDITQRAIRILKEVDCIAAEDTRHSKPFLMALGVKTPCFALHAHNEAEVSTRFIARLQKGENVALISDAGTPLIRDPGYPLVVAAHAAGIQVVPIPGACAFVAALSAAGVPADCFTFCGFLPATHSARVQSLQALDDLTSHTLIFYESTHRLMACLQDIKAVFGPETKLVLAKELTKTFEAFTRGVVDEVETWLLLDEARQKGEFVIMVLPRPPKEKAIEGMRCLEILLKELPVKQAVKLAVALTGESRNVLYALAVADKS